MFAFIFTLSFPFSSLLPPFHLLLFVFLYHFLFLLYSLFILSSFFFPFILSSLHLFVLAFLSLFSLFFPHISPLFFNHDFLYFLVTFYIFLSGFHFLPFQTLSPISFPSILTILLHCLPDLSSFPLRPSLPPPPLPRQLNYLCLSHSLHDSPHNRITFFLPSILAPLLSFPSMPRIPLTRSYIFLLYPLLYLPSHCTLAGLNACLLSFPRIP